MVKNSFIWIIGITIAVISGLVAVGAIAKNKNPQLAISLQPLNGFAAENLASTPVKLMIAENRGQFPNRINSNAINLAKQAFIAEPITPQAVAVLALGGAENNKHKLMRDALSLSRREQLITSWMIADSGAREDISAILRYYDTMLRTSSSAAPVVIPVMAAALANDNFVEPFSSLLAKKPPWANQFWGTVVGAPNSLVNAARLREALFKPNESENSYRDAALVRALTSNKNFEQAEALYRLLASQQKTDSLLENGYFNTEPKYPPIDWQLFSTGEYGAVIADGKLELSAIRNSGGRFARQLVILPSGILTIEAKSAAAIPDDTRIAISLVCAEDIAKMPRPITISLESLVTKQRISNKLTQCRYYWFDIIGRSAEIGDGFDVGLETISLHLE